MKYLSPTFDSIRLVFADRRYIWTFFLLFVFIFWTLVYIQVKSIPGNDLYFQLSLFGFWDYFLLGTLSLLTSLSGVINIFAFNQKKSLRVGLRIVGHGGFGGISAVFASIFGTASCGICIGALFSFLGVGGIFFLLDYRIHITVASIILMLLSIHFSSQKVLGVCRIIKTR
jgi:hypothetical protein